MAVRTREEKNCEKSWEVWLKGENDGLLRKECSFCDPMNGGKGRKEKAGSPASLTSGPSEKKTRQNRWGAAN